MIVHDRAGERPLRALAFAAILLFAAAGCERSGGGLPGNPRVVVLGFDGIDPELLDRFRAAGRLPNIDALAREGDVRTLQTTTPPLPPVAWSSFATGLPPADHGVLGLVRRDPADYEIRSAAQTIDGPEFFLTFETRGPTVRSLRRGRTFWSVADAAGRRAVVLRVPYDFPPAPLVRGRSLSGEGVPDVRFQTSGYTQIASGPTETTNPGATQRVRWVGHRGTAEVPGLRTGGVTAPAIEIALSRVGDAVRIEIGEEASVLERGEWSEPVAVRFDLTPFRSISANVRFYLRELEPRLEILLSEPNIDPRDPWMPLSMPPDFAGQLWHQIGPYDTLGWAQPTEAYADGILDEEAFATHVATSLSWSRRATLHEIDQRDADLVVSVFTETDRVSHLFYREMGEGMIEDIYRAMDRIVGDVRSHLPDQTKLLVVSAYGFEPFQRVVSLNAWLERAGLQVRSSGAGDGLATVDWGRTRAYAIGAGQIYLNLRGREREGVVAPGPEADALLVEIQSTLLGLRDPATDVSVVAAAERGTALFAGPAAPDAPDLLVSFASGYRSAFADDSGGIAPQVIAPNVSRWSGGHGGALATDVPGVLLSSEALRPGEASLLDIAPTVLEWLGVPIPPELRGRALGVSR